MFTSLQTGPKPAHEPGQPCELAEAGGRLLHHRTFLAESIFQADVAEAGWLCEVWEKLRTLLAFLDRLPLRRTLVGLHGFSRSSVWKMSGNVLEVRYKVISRQVACMNRTIASLREFIANSTDAAEISAARDVLKLLLSMQMKGLESSDWYSKDRRLPVLLAPTGNFGLEVAVAPCGRSKGIRQILVWRESWQNEAAL